MKSDPLIISNVVGCALGSEGRAVGPLMGVYWVFYRSNRVLLLFHHKVVNNKLRLIVFLNKAFCSLHTVTLATCSVESTLLVTESMAIMMVEYLFTFRSVC